MIHNYSFTDDEDSVLLDMFQYFDDIGLPDHIDQKDYESLQNKFFGADVNHTYRSVE
tara:strand:- start:548 stop:718 length:171 start_codon:yes stop_codon:yes gene_type:complete